MPKFFFLFPLLLLVATTAAQEEQVPHGWSDQQVLVAKLSGELPITEGQRLSSRWTAAERTQSREFLQQYFAMEGLTLIEQAYAMPNTYAFQDLLLGPFRGANLYGILPSTTPSKDYVLLGAHYDTERNAPGAIDNASSIAVIYGIVQQLLQLEQRDKNLLVVFFDQEEEEIVGSRAFIKFLATQNWEIASVHTMDMMGWDQDGDRAIEIELPTPILVPHYLLVGKSLGIPIHQTRVNGSDHQAFREAGFTVTGITGEYANGDSTPYKDTPADTYDTVNFEFVESSTKLLSRVFTQLVQGDKSGQK